VQLPANLYGESLKRLLQGAAVGAIATVVIGFGWGGWVLGRFCNEFGIFNFGGCGISVSFDAPINFHPSLSLMVAIQASRLYREPALERVNTAFGGSAIVLRVPMLGCPRR
jgi:hypothetical protein